MGVIHWQTVAVHVVQYELLSLFLLPLESEGNFKCTNNATQLTVKFVQNSTGKKLGVQKIVVYTIFTSVFLIYF